MPGSAMNWPPGSLIPCSSNLTVQHEIWKDTRIEVGYVAKQAKNAQSK